MTFDRLQPAAFRLRLNSGWHRRMYLLRFPEHWKAPLLSLSSRRKDGSTPQSIRIRLLNDVITALVPDVLTPATKATIGDRAPWLYADVPVDRHALFAITAAWVRHESSDTALVAAVLGKLSADDLEWEPLDVDFATLARGITPNADRGQDDAYQLLPHALAAELAAPESAHEHLMPNTGDDEPEVHAISRFRRFPVAGSGAGVMSWPPHYAPSKPLSFVLSISVQTRAFDDAPLVHLGIGTRRWAHRPVTLSSERNHTLYLLPSVPWLEGIVQSHSFLAAAIEPHRSINEDGNSVWTAKWAGNRLGRILADLGCHHRLPHPAAVKEDPAACLNQRDAAALVFRNGMYPFDHPVSPGTSLKDKVPLFDWAADVWSEYLDPVPTLPKKHTTILPHVQLQKAKYEQTAGAGLRAAIAEEIGPALGADIYFDTASTSSYALRTLSSMLDINLSPEIDLVDLQAAPHTISTPELTIHLTIRPVGAWGADLAPDQTVKNKDERLQASINARIKLIAEEVGLAQTPSIALVEIQDKDSYTGRRRALDPKFAIKAGLVRRGRLTQCVTEAPAPEPPDAGTASKKSDPSEEKLSKSWADLLRQLGVRQPSLPSTAPRSNIQTPPAYLAFWLVRQNRHAGRGATRQVPVAVLIDPTGQTIKVCAPQVDWLPLYQAQQAISESHMLSNQKRAPEDVTRFFEDVFRTVVRLHPATLLLTCAQNLRSYWPNLTNSNLSPDTLGFGVQTRPISRYPGLRHVHIRLPSGNEVPECFAVGDEDTGHSKGLWEAGERVFLSTAGKPGTAGGAIKGISKIVPYLSEYELKNPSPKARVWNARALEITVAALQPGDEPSQWAALTHDLRWATTHFDGATTLPWPLDVANQLSEYIMPIELLEEAQELPDAEVAITQE